MSTIVIVGASLAGASAAETLRAEGFEGRIVLVGDEVELPYERPPLSKGYLTGASGRDVVFLHDEAFYTGHGIELRTGTEVTALDLASSRVVLDTGERVGFDRVLLATGALPRRLPVPGARLDGVYHLRDLADALRTRLERGGRLVVVGAGWIGTEIAASARQHGVEVTLVERGRVPVARVLGPEVGEVYRRLHAARGVDLLPDTGVVALRVPAGWNGW